MGKYRVYFRQINQEVYEVEARNEESAAKKAEKEWRSYNKYPTLIDIEKK